MTVELSSQYDTRRLWNGEQSQHQSQGDVEPNNPFSRDSEEAMLTGLTEQLRNSYNGRATGNRISNQPGYSDDPIEALAEWVVAVEEFVNGKQGSGRTLTDSNRGTEVTGVLESFGWQRQYGEPFEVQWDLQLVAGEGLSIDEEPNPPSVSPQQKSYLDGWDLGHVETWREDKNQRVQAEPKTFAEPGDNPIMSESGAIRSITVSGRISGEEHRNNFDDHMRSLVGSNQIVQYESAFPGRTIDVMVRSYESTREAGVTRLGDYSLDLIEGRSLIGSSDTIS